MVSRTKALTSLVVSGGVVAFRCGIYQKLDDLLYLCPVLVTYCLWDLKNTTDMVIHHLATIALNITLVYAIYNLSYLGSAQVGSVGEIVTSLFDLEVSTVFLALMHLGYRHLLLQGVFLLTFFYYRIVQLNYVLARNYQAGLLDTVCQESTFCLNTWYFGCPPLVLLNYYWFYLIIKKVRRQMSRVARKREPLPAGVSD